MSHHGTVSRARWSGERGDPPPPLSRPPGETEGPCPDDIPWVWDPNEVFPAPILPPEEAEEEPEPKRRDRDEPTRGAA